MGFTTLVIISMFDQLLGGECYHANVVSKLSAHQILFLVTGMTCHDLLCIGRLVSKADEVMNIMHIYFVGNTPMSDLIIP